MIHLLIIGWMAEPEKGSRYTIFSARLIEATSRYNANWF
jgi:hypothetical protein